MATRNERRRKAKARCLDLKAACEAAFAHAKATAPVIVQPKQDVFDVSGVLRGHNPPIQRLGSIVRGQFQRAQTPKLPAKRILTLNPITGKLIEKKKGAI